MHEEYIETPSRKGVLGWIMRHPKITLALGLMLLITGFLLLWDRGVTKGVQARLAAIRAKGEPVTVEDLKALDSPIPPEQNMTIALLKAVKSFTDLNIPKEYQLQLLFLGFATSTPTGQPRPSEQVKAMQWFVEQHSEVIEALHRALQREKAWFDYKRKTPLIMVSLNELADLRKAPQVFAMESAHAVENGNHVVAGQRLLDSYRCSKVFQNRYPNLIVFLTQISMFSLAEDSTERAINRCDLGTDVLEKIKIELRNSQQETNFLAAVQESRVEFYDAAEWIHSRSGGISFSNGLVSVPILRSLDVACGLDIYARLIAAAEVDEKEILPRMRQVANRIDDIPQYYVLSKSLVTSITRATELWLRFLGTTRALQVAIACEQYRLHQGTWPSHLNVLVPDFIEAIPLDPFDGKPIRYAIIREGIKIWTIGENMKDDGGDVRRLEVFSAKIKPTDWGWVLLNPELRGRAVTTTPAATSGPAH